MADSYASRICRRASYRRFRELYDLLKTGPEPGEVLHLVHSLMEKYRGFRSRAESERAMETIRFIVGERGDDSYTLCFTPGELDMLQRTMREIDSRAEGMSTKVYLEPVNSSIGVDGWTCDEEIPDEVCEQAAGEWAAASVKIMNRDPEIVRRRRKEG